MAKALLITGTSSGAGKSLLVTALTRLASRRGIKVSPFKAQNMSLHSFVAVEGGEIGIAQAIQAMAAKLAPSVYHNPILLKSEGERGIQVILHGKTYKVMKGKEYYQEKDFLWEYVKASLDSLLSQYELIIMEGAGSPAEINLLDCDLVNIKPALYTKAKVLLVGDIDRGGVFASLYGTVKLLQEFLPEYAQRIEGYLINKFRGELDLLRPGIKRMDSLFQIPCVGVLPYFQDLYFAEEDSLQIPWKYDLSSFRTPKDLKVAVIRFPSLAIFSDLDPLRFEPDVSLFLTDDPNDLLKADLIILPGSKRTVKDLLWLKKKGFDQAIKVALKRGSMVFGICGGYQCLGERIVDQEKVESELPEITGLSLLPIETFFSATKTTTEVSAESLRDGIEGTLWGFEIHKGHSRGELNLFLVRRSATGETILEGSVKDEVWGTYLHGIFTNDSFRRYLLNFLREKKGLLPLKQTYNFWPLLDQSIDYLAELVERYVDIKTIFKDVVDNYE